MSKIIILINLPNCIVLSLACLRYGDLILKKSHLQKFHIVILDVIINNLQLYKIRK